MELSKDNILTRAAVLLFSKRPTRFNMLAVCKIGRFSGNSDVDLITDDVVSGPLYRMSDKIMELLLGKYFTKTYIYQGLQRVETLVYPESSLREAILNAVIHRDYSGNSFFYIKIFDESIELWNEGVLMEPLTIKALYEKHSSRRRNPIIAEIFYRSGQIEAWGRGSLKMIQNAKKKEESLPLHSILLKMVYLCTLEKVIL
ncbi:MAG: ATP-binding protein [Bacteroidales bacterium]